MDPSKHVDPRHVSVSLKASTPREAIEELLDLLVATAAVAVPLRDEVLKEILDRESRGSTGIGYEIAIPHAKTDHVKDLTVALGLHTEGIGFDSIDKKPVRIFVLTLSPKKVSGPHLQFMASIAGILKDESVRKKLLASRDPQAASRLLAGPS